MTARHTCEECNTISRNLWGRALHDAGEYRVECPSCGRPEYYDLEVEA